jgi:cytochrome c5
MPPQGGGDFSDFEIARAVVYMASKAGGSFPEPAPPATAATSAAATTTVAAAPAAPTPAPAAAPRAEPMTTVATAANTATTSAPPALYNQVCSACHATGVAGAPKVGDKAAWTPRAAQGVDALTVSAIKGKGAMPPKGGSSASDADLKAVVAYMVAASK